MGSIHRIVSIEPNPETALSLVRPQPGGEGGSALVVAGSCTDPHAATIEAARGRALAGSAPGPGGRFSLIVDLFGLPPPVRLHLRAILHNGRRRRLATLVIDRRAEPDDPGGPQPLTITSLGRSGSTYLMRLLLAHPEIGGHPVYPYEARWMAHAMALRRLVVVGGDAFPAGLPEGIWEPGDPVDPGVPGAEETALAVREAAADDLARAMIRRFYGEDRRYMLEKGAPAEALAELFAEPREIFLIRDPRDVFASVLAFNEKRGFADFGRQEVASDEAFVGPFASRVEWFLRNRRARRGIPVRYEDLVTDPDGVVEGITSTLGIAAGAVPAAEAAPTGPDDLLDAHRTSADAAASVGRWRRDLSAPLRRMLDEALTAALEELGYRR
jgi:hypothetical protein